MDQSFADRLVGISERDVLADERDLDRGRRFGGARNDCVPLTQVSRSGLKPELVADKIVYLLLAVPERHFVDVIDILGRDHGLNGE